MTEFYLLGSVIVFIYLSVVMYKEMPHEGFNKLHDIIGWSLFIFILSCLSWVSILTWVYVRIRKKL